MTLYVELGHKKSSYRFVTFAERGLLICKSVLITDVENVHYAQKILKNDTKVDYSQKMLYI